MNDNNIERRDFNLEPQPKIVDFEIIHEIPDWLAIDIRDVIDERIISTLRGMAPRRPAESANHYLILEECDER